MFSKTITDFRQKDKTSYDLDELITIGVLIFLLKLESRRSVKYKLDTPHALYNVWQFLRSGGKEAELFSDGIKEGLPHGDTINYLLSGISNDEVSKIPTEMVRALIRRKSFVLERLQSIYYIIALDGTGLIHFVERHCPNCLYRKTGTNENGEAIYTYFHYVLEAKLITSYGLALSIATEFIENEEGFTKQDCELKAFYRLAPRLKSSFPQMKICLIGDALYAGKPFFDICEKNHWKYIISFKEGVMPATYKEYEALKSLSNKEEITKEIVTTKTFQKYTFITDIDYGKHKLNVLELEEKPNQNKKGKQNHKFVWITNISIKKSNCEKIAKGGRLRQKIENEGFNMQKNGGYCLEHPYSKNPTAMKNFYFLLQIAHIINQLMEKGSLLKNQLFKVYGGIKNFTLILWRTFTTKNMDEVKFNELLNTAIQIRFDTS